MLARSTRRGAFPSLLAAVLLSCSSPAVTPAAASPVLPPATAPTVSAALTVQPSVTATPLPAPTPTRPSTPTPGPPRVTFRVDADVSADDVRDARDGIAMADAYYASAFGAMRTRPFVVQIRTAGPWEPGSGNGCCYADGPISTTIHFHTSVPIWSDSQVGTGRIAHLKNTIHEYGHLWSGEPGGRGCFQQAGRGYLVPRWFAEGLAEFAAYDALRAQGLLSRDHLSMYLEGVRTRLVVGLAALEASPWPSNVDAYGLSRAAVSRLVDRAGAEGVARFCTVIGGGATWQAALQQVFGLSPAAFYGEFDAWAAAGRSSLSAPFSIRAIEQLAAGAIPERPKDIAIAFEVLGFDLGQLTREQSNKLIVSPANGWTATPRYRFVLLLDAATRPGLYTLVLRLPDGRQAEAAYSVSVP